MPNKLAKALTAAGPGPEPLSSTNLELVFDRDAKRRRRPVRQQRLAPGSSPNPITKLAWGNAALLSPKTAAGAGLSTATWFASSLTAARLEIAAMVLPGQADYSVGLSLGYGRTACGRVGKDVGFNAYVLRTSSAPDIALGLKVLRPAGDVPLACTQEHFTMDGRDVIRELTLADLIVRTVHARRPP